MKGAAGVKGPRLVSVSGVKGAAAECHEDSQKPLIGNFLRSSDRGSVMR